MIRDTAIKFVDELFNYTDAGDWDNLARYFHDDIVYERPGYDSVMPVIGKAAVMKFFRDTRKVKSGIHTTESVLVHDDEIVCLGHFEGLSKEDKPLTARYADYYKMVDGLIIHRVSYFI